MPRHGGHPPHPLRSDPRPQGSGSGVRGEAGAGLRGSLIVCCVAAQARVSIGSCPKPSTSSPSERTKRFRRSADVRFPARLVVVWGLRASERSSCIYRWSARFGPFWAESVTQSRRCCRNSQNPQTPFISRKLTGRARPPSPGICTLPTPSARLAGQQPFQNGLPGNHSGGI